MILNNKRHAFDSNRLWWAEVTVSTELSQVSVHNTPLNGLSKNILYVDETGLQVCVCVCVCVCGCFWVFEWSFCTIVSPKCEWTHQNNDQETHRRQTVP